jgi:hypothetical protein
VLPVKGRHTAGVSSSEQYLAGLCEQSFLSLWSHPNLFKELGKELCDLLVVFGDELIIFSDKSCVLNAKHSEGWRRWYRKAVTKSSHQLHSAAAWLRSQSSRVFLDAKCSEKFPFTLPSTRPHLVAIATGAGEACRERFGGNGSLSLAAVTDGTSPFTIGDIDPSLPFVHVFDNIGLDRIMSEVDTIADFVDYLRHREAFMRSGMLLAADSEEHLLAHYLSNIDSSTGEHGFVFPPDTTHVVLDGGWDSFVTSTPYKSKKAADRVSYVWDRMIESLAKHAVDRTLVVGNERTLEEHERELRLLAAESRVDRRVLSMGLLDLMAKADHHDLVFRFISPSPRRQHGYVLMGLRRAPAYGTEERYREFRQKVLARRCEVAKLHHPDSTLVAGLAFGAERDRDNSIDLIIRDFADWSEEDAARAEEIRKAMQWQPNENLDRYDIHVDEYPDRPGLRRTRRQHRGK